MILERISVLITLTLTLLLVFGINYKSVIGNRFWDQFPGCRGISISPPVLLDVPPPWGLHLHSRENTYALKLFLSNFQKITLTLPLLSVFELRM